MAEDKTKYTRDRFDFAQELRNKFVEELEPSRSKWDRGYNAGIHFAIRVLDEYRNEYARRFPRGFWED